MNNEINIKRPGQILDYVDTKEHLLDLYNYITNLQESEAYYYGQYKDHKSRNEKAIEYIKETSFFYKSHYDFKNDLLNILQGSDKYE